MKLYIAKLGADSGPASVFSMMCVKYDAKSSILPTWLSPDDAGTEVPNFTREEYRIEELDQAEYAELADQHLKLGINLFLHVRRPEAGKLSPDAEDQAAIP